MDNDREAESIRHEMAKLRREADAHAEVVRSRAREMTDWRYYVRKYPKTSLLAAAAVGYLLVSPKVRKTVVRKAVDAATAGGREALGAAPPSSAGWEPALSAAAKIMVKHAVPLVSAEALRWWRSYQSEHDSQHNGQHSHQATDYE